VSALFALLVGAGLAAPLCQRAIYLVLNSLVIFSMGIGSNALGSRAALPAGPPHSGGYHGPLGPSPAYAQQPPPAPSSGSSEQATRARLTGAD
jgi:hypothetical protein